jgi:hypothetical protein
MKTSTLPELLACFSLLSLLVNAFAVTPAAAPTSTPVPPPTAPFISAPPQFCSWTIQAVNKPVATQMPSAKQPSTQALATNQNTSTIQNQTNALPEPTPVKQSVPVIQASNTITGDIKRIDTLSADGRRQELWFDKNLQFSVASNDPSHVIVMEGGAGPAPDGSLRSPVVGPGFPSFWWLGLSCYKDVVKVNGRSCYHFHVIPPPQPVRKAHMTEEEEMKLPAVVITQEKEAWIDVETKLPVALGVEGLIYTYTFLPPPTSPLTLPQTMQTEITRQNSGIERLRKLQSVH